ncbi:LuxR family transcriptional regulator [Streptomyces sp. SCSIO 30461]|uniref:helix-turn-helix transcriptional regulator n=1 Tax=Streptomyces sp. SCSIO 30461 TaxID=3118085 RepID=UPI0030D18E59
MLELIGRDAELVRLGPLIAGLGESGGPVVVDITGDAGIGKSRLLGAVCSRAVRGGMTVLRGRATEFERHTPFQAFTDAFTDLDAHELMGSGGGDGTDASVFADAAPVVCGVSHAPTGDPGAADRFGVYRAVARLLSGLGGSAAGRGTAGGTGRSALGRPRVAGVARPPRAAPGGRPGVARRGTQGPSDADPARRRAHPWNRQRRRASHEAGSSAALAEHRGDRGTAPRLLDEAVREHTVMGAALWEAYSLPRGVVLARSAGDAPRAAAMWRRARRLADGGGARLLVDLADLIRPQDAGEDRDGHAVPTDPARLTAREREIAGLVARGFTSSRIATELFLTAKTVEGRLTRIFRKLHIDSRAAPADPPEPVRR